MDDFLDLIEKQSNDNTKSTSPLTLSGQFVTIPNIKPDFELCKEAKHWKNFEKNRYSNVLALEMTRVKMKEYINANYVFLGKKDIMIATQAPLDATVTDFWEMVMFTGANTIFMLTGLVENEKRKCSLYWPLDGIKNIPGGFIENMGIDRPLSFVEITKLRLTLKGETRDITHIFYTNWSDFAVPDVQELKKTLEILERYKTPEVPFICHCSAGVGRTGVVASILRIKNTKETARDCVEMLRKYRLGMVQTVEQFKFIDLFLNQDI